MPVKNGAKWLSGSLKSIELNLKSTDELIVIDDGSTDNTNKILEQFAPNFSYQVIRTKSRGIVEALNLGIAESNFDWIARFDVDDVYTPDRIDTQRHLIDKETSVIFSDYCFASEEGTFLGSMPSPVNPTATSLSLINSQRTAHPSALISKRHFQEVGGYRFEDFPAEDLSLWIRLSRVGHLRSVPKNLLRYTLRRSSITGERYQEAKSKQLELLKFFKFGPSESKRAIEELLETFTEYKSMELGNIRKFLHLYDLNRAETLGFLHRRFAPKIKLELARLLVNLENTKSIYNQFYFRKKRQQFRALR